MSSDATVEPVAGGCVALGGAVVGGAVVGVVVLGVVWVGVVGEVPAPVDGVGSWALAAGVLQYDENGLIAIEVPGKGGLVIEHRAPSREAFWLWYAVPLYTTTTSRRVGIWLLDDSTYTGCTYSRVLPIGTTSTSPSSTWEPCSL